jgi:hypothetical protein
MTGDDHVGKGQQALKYIVLDDGIGQIILATRLPILPVPINPTVRPCRSKERVLKTAILSAIQLHSSN